MAKIEVVRADPVTTLTLNGGEAEALAALLWWGTDAETVDRLGLRDLADKMYDEFEPKADKPGFMFLAESNY